MNMFYCVQLCSQVIAALAALLLPTILRLVPQERISSYLCVSCVLAAGRVPHPVSSPASPAHLLLSFFPLLRITVALRSVFTSPLSAPLDHTIYPTFPLSALLTHFLGAPLHVFQPYFHVLSFFSSTKNVFLQMNSKAVNRFLQSCGKLCTSRCNGCKSLPKKEGRHNIQVTK